MKMNINIVSRLRLATWLVLLVMVFLLSSIQSTSSVRTEDLPSLPDVVSQVSFKWKEVNFEVQIVPSADSSIRKGHIGGDNNTGAPEFSGDCTLVLKSKDKELSRLKLESLGFVYSDGKWTVTGKVPLHIFKREKSPPWICFRQHACSNGNYYYFYWIENIDKQPRVKPLLFVDKRDSRYANRVYAGHYKPIEFVRSRGGRFGNLLSVRAYDNNLLGSDYIKFYAERMPGEMLLVGMHSWALPNKFGESEK